MKQTACEKNDLLLRQMIEDGESLTAIAQTVGTNRTRVKEYIAKHDIQHQPFHTTNFGYRNGRWKGGRIIDEDGYILIKQRKHPHCNRHGYVREHRLVVEKVLGRYLTPREVVHHIDGNKQNNRPDNLQVYGSNGKHLAEELVGKIPNWTEDGKRRISAGARKPRPKATQQKS